jgi:hypothetical protein
MENETSNRRHFSRIHFNTPGRLSFGEGTFNVEVRDLSLKGALVKLPPFHALQVGQSCDLSADLGGASDSGETVGEGIIHMVARVAHVREQEVGLRCVEIDLDSITHLRRLVELNLGDESLLHRELEYLAQG